jgi:hypothetical protein
MLPRMSTAAVPVVPPRVRQSVTLLPAGFGAGAWLEHRRCIRVRAQERNARLKPGYE